MCIVPPLYLMVTLIVNSDNQFGFVTAEDIVTDVYGYPVVSAMKLIKVLCLTGRNLAASLVRVEGAVADLLSPQRPY